MQTIGLIGGMSWESSKVYYELINRRVQELLGGSHSAKSIMVSVDFAEIERLSFEGDWEAIGEMMKDAAQKLERAGAEVIILCTNTIHIVSNYITENIGVPFIHIAKATGQAIVDANVKKVALLGTRFTMEKEFYSKTLIEDFDLEVLIPDEESRTTIHSIIYNELVKGQFTDIAKQEIVNIIDALQAQGAEGVILGCTELPILISPSDLNIPSFDTTKIHAYEAVDRSIKVIV